MSTFSYHEHKEMAHWLLQLLRQKGKLGQFLESIPQNKLGRRLHHFVDETIDAERRMTPPDGT